MKGINISFLVLIFCFALTSCGESESEEKMVFRYNEQTGIASMDPAFAKNQSIMWAVQQVFNTLVETNQDLNIGPSLAYRCDVSEDRKTYVFHLRPDVYFHDNEVFPGGKGRKMVAADVVYSLQRIMDPSVASSGAWIFNNRVNKNTGFEAPDDSTFRLTLIRPFTPILGLLSMQYCSIVPR